MTNSMTTGIKIFTQWLPDWVPNRRYLWIPCFFLVYVSSFTLCGRSLPSPNLDDSYQVVLEYAKTHDFQFGRDIVYTFGPLGFLNTSVSLGLLPLQRILFALAWSGIVAWSVTGLARQIPGTMKFVFLVWILIYSGGLGQHAFLVMIYGCVILMDEVQKLKGAAAAFLTVFAILALVKFTFFVAVMVSVVLCVLVHLGKRCIKSSFFIAMYFVLVFLAIWLAAGQQFESLLPWLRGSFEIAAGFTEAMTIFPHAGVLLFCSVSGALFLVSLGVIIRSIRLSVYSGGIMAVTTAYVFLSWKHGFVRADGHVLGFVFFLPMAFAVLLTETFQNGMSRKARRYLAAVFMGVIIMCNWAADLQDPGTMLTKLIDWPGHMLGNSRTILNSVTGNWENCFEALQADHSRRLEPDLPIARAMVDKAPVDVINYTQLAALVNNMHYRPRPVIQGYTAYTPYLQDLNLAYYRSEKRPQYLLLRMETIDNRFPALDDATILPYILNNYKPAAKDGAKDGGFLVLKALPEASKNIGLALVHEHTIAFGESLDMSLYNDKLYIMRVEVGSTILGEMIKFLFQAPVLTMNVQNNEKTTKYRFIPAMAERGFVISPLLLTNDDVMRYYNGVAVNCADIISFSKPKYALSRLSETISVRIYKQNVL